MKRWTRRPEGSTWGDFGPDDEIGRLNLLTEEKVLQAVREVRAGKVFCLSLPLDLPGGNVLNPRRHPPALAPTRRDGQPYLNFQMSRLQEGAVDVLSDDQATLSLQYSTQWDGLSHVGALFDVQGDGQARRVYYNGYAAGVDVLGGGDPGADACCPPGASYARRLSVSRYAEKGMQGRGVLLDLARAFGTGRTPVGLAQLQAAMHEQRVAVEPGDMLVLRTGFAEALVQMDGKPDAHRLEQTGAVLDGADAALLDWITDSGVAAICADNYAVEAYPRARPAPAIRSCRCIITACSSWACRWPSSGT